MTIKDLGDKYKGHAWLSKIKDKTMVLDPIDGIVYFMVCPHCGDNKDLRHYYNWHPSKMLDEPLKIECQRCGEIYLQDNMDIEILKEKK